MKIKKKTMDYSKGIALLLFVLLLGCSDSEKARKVTDYSIEQLLENNTLLGGSFSFDESKILFTSDESGVFNCYSLSLEHDSITPLTQSDSANIYSISYFPNDDRVLFRSDNNGNEVFHIYLYDTNGQLKDLTPGLEVRSTFYAWNEDGQSFIYTSNKRDSRYMDVYEMDIINFEEKLLFKNDEAFKFGGISKDKKYLAIKKSITRANDKLFLYSLPTKKMIQIAGQKGNANYSPTGFDPVSKSLFYTTNKDAEFHYLVKYNIVSGKAEKMLEYDWDIIFSQLSYNGKFRVTGVNEDGETRIGLNKTSTAENTHLPSNLPTNIAYARLSDSERHMIFLAGSSKSPADLYIYDFETEEVRQLVSGMNPAINPNELVEGIVVRYPSFDGLEIPAILYKPHQVSKKVPGPALVWVHGGPGGQSRLSYSPFIQYLVNKGYTILAVNNRGSSGYGKTFYSLDDRNHGKNDLMDCILGKEYLRSTGFVDTANIGIMGRSFGGFMVMAALTFHPEEFKTGVNFVGVTNWLRTLNSIPPWWESEKALLYNEMGDPKRDSARLYQISPLFHAEQIRRPFMVLQGANDPRVLQAESDDIVSAARKNGVEVEYLLFENEGHQFVKKENQLIAYKKILEFLDKQLNGIEPEEENTKLLELNPVQ